MSNAEYDVVIVGAGIAGAIVAERVASEGLSVLVLEAGPPRDSRQEHMRRFYQKAAKVPGSPWPHPKEANSPGVLDVIGGDWKDGDKYYMDQTGPHPFMSTYERLEGGTGNHWQGLTPRLLPNDFRIASEYGSPEGAPDWPKNLQYEHLEKWYAEAEHFIGVSGNHEVWDKFAGASRSRDFPMPEIPQSYLDSVVTRCLSGEKIGGTISAKRELLPLPIPQARNSVGFDGRPPCMGNTNCIPICPITAKYDSIIHLDRAIRKPKPAEIRFRSVASRIDVDPKCGKVTGVRYLNWDGSAHVAVGRQYVIAANPIETAKLMLISPWKTVKGVERAVGNRSDQVGRNLMDHLIYLCWGLLKEPAHAFRGPQTTTTIGEFRDGDERRKRAAWIIMCSNAGWGWPTGAPISTVQAQYRAIRDADRSPGDRGKQLKEELRDHISRQVSFTAEFEQLPSPYNRVRLSSRKSDKLGLPRAEIAYALSPYSRAGFVDAHAAMNEVLKAVTSEGGYSDTRTGQPNSFAVDGTPFQHRGAGHILGTTRAGDDEETSVVDHELRCHDHENLFVVGGAVFPTIGTANPTLTIAALALRAADTLVRTNGGYA